MVIPRFALIILHLATFGPKGEGDFSNWIIPPLNCSILQSRSDIQQVLFNVFISVFTNSSWSYQTFIFHNNPHQPRFSLSLSLSNPKKISLTVIRVCCWKFVHVGKTWKYSRCFARSSSSPRTGSINRLNSHDHHLRCHCHHHRLSSLRLNLQYHLYVDRLMLIWTRRQRSPIEVQSVGYLASTVCFCCLRMRFQSSFDTFEWARGLVAKHVSPCDDFV